MTDESSDKLKEELISIVVPVYNVEKYLKRCIESILNQTYKNIEIILVDDGATDNSGKMCDDFLNLDNRIKVIHKRNGGLSDARNHGIEIAKGKYIGFIDSDDYIESKMYELLYKNIVANNADISICDRFINYEDGRQIIKNKKEEKFVMNKKEGLIELNSFKHFDMAVWNKLYKIELFKEIKFPVGKISEDYYTMYKLFDKSNVIVYDSTPMYHYYQREGSISRTKAMNTAYLDASKSQVEYFQQYHPELLYIAYTSYVFANIAHLNKFINYNIKYEKNMALELKKEVKKYLRYVLKNPYISKFKKFQAIVFSKSIHIYVIIKKIF